MSLTTRAARYERSSVFHPAMPPVFTSTVQLRGEHELHSHDFLETAVVRSGTGVHVTAGSEHELIPGALVVVRPGSWHGYSRCDDLVVTNCCFGSELFGRELAWLRADPAISRLLWSAPVAAGRSGAYVGALPDAAVAGAECALSGLAASFDAPGPAQRARLLGWLVVLLGELASGPPHDGVGERPVPSVVVAALRLLDDAPEHDWSVPRLAAAVSVGGAHLTRLFTLHVGAPPMTYLTRVRAERAASLLLDSDALVAAIGSAVGWSDPNYFARRFRAHYGMSPGEYRRRGASLPEHEHGHR